MQPPASARSSERAQARFARIAVTPGEVSEWSKVLDSKSSVAQATGGSNPPLSANARPVPDHCSTQCSGNVPDFQIRCNPEFRPEFLPERRRFPARFRSLER
jgi:hypothetical protein